MARALNLNQRGSMQARSLLNRPWLWLWGLLFAYTALAWPLPLAQAAPQRPTTVEGLSPALLQVTHGKASYYSKKHSGKKTANGQRIDHGAYTAAHPTLPFGTVVRVTNLRNGREVIVRINDRGPFVKGRIIDLSRAAAETLNMMRSGVTDVQVEVLSDGKGKISQPEGGFFLALKEAIPKERTVKALEQARAVLSPVGGEDARNVQILSERTSGAGERFYAAIGPFASYAAVSSARKRLERKRVPATVRWAYNGLD